MEESSNYIENIYSGIAKSELKKKVDGCNISTVKVIFTSPHPMIHLIIHPSSITHFYNCHRVSQIVTDCHELPNADF